MANDNNIQPMADDSQIVLYQPDDSIRLEVKLEQDTVWLTQAQMTELFRTTRNNITMHIRNIFKEKELDEKSVCKESLHTAADGKRYRTKIYNLDVIISVGYRVKSPIGTRFRQWANAVIKQYLLQGYSVNRHLIVLQENMDIRKGSPTYGKHVAVELTEDNHVQFFMPKGFAHGFAVLSETAVFQYKCDNFYHPEADGGISILDDTLGIDWKIPTEHANLSEKDTKHAMLKDFDSPFDINIDLYK